MNKTPIWSRNGILARVRQVASPNQDARPTGACIQLLVIHGISLPPGHFRGSAIEKLFTNRLDHDEHVSFSALRGLRVSSHFLIRRGGAALQFVACDRRAWHAGISTWKGMNRCTDFSIGIELMNTKDDKCTGEQYSALKKLIADLKSEYKIKYVLGHNQIAPGRKTDPWNFDWSRL